jgi:hypothetical protein
MKKAIFSILLIAFTICICIPAHPAAAEMEGVTLTRDGLSQFLSNMGYEPKGLSKGYLLAVKQDTWTLNMQVVISENGQKIGLNANLGKVEYPSSVTAEQWMKLLISNGDIEPSIFYFDKDQSKLYLHRAFDNRAMTPAIMRHEIEKFCSDIRSTEALWKFTK